MPGLLFGYLLLLILLNKSALSSSAKYSDHAGTIRDSLKGKQFVASCEKSGRTPDTFFGLDNEKKHLYIAEVMLTSQS